MANRGKKVLFYSSVKDKELFNIQRFYKTDIQILQELGYSVLLSNKISDAWRFWTYDFVFAYFYRYSFFVALIAILFGRRTYFTGGIDALDQDLVSRRDYEVQRSFFRLCYALSKKCIIVSKTDDSNVRKIVPGKKLVYSEHTIETSLFNCNLDEKDNICTTIAWQATKANVERKGVDTALRLFERLHKLERYKDYKFVIIGKSGEGTKYLLDLVNALCIKDYVEFTDSISESKKIEFLKRSKIYFQLSKFEGFGVASLEALCAKNIVIHSGKGGLSNPIYDSGIKVNIEQHIDEMFTDFLCKISSFENKQLQEANSNVCKQYDNERRKNEFATIIEE